MSEDEIEGALALVDMMTVDALEGPDFVDHCTEALEQVNEAKREDREPPAGPEPEAEPGRVLDLMAALNASVQKAKQARGEGQEAEVHEMPTPKKKATKKQPAKTAAKKTAAMLQSGGLLFFAFAGYARIATLGEEVRDPARTIPRAVLLALGSTLLVYAVVAVSALAVLGPQRLAHATAPLSDAVRVAGVDWLTPAVRVGAAVAALGSLLALILGASRTTLAMARDRHLPHALSAVHPRFKVPHRAELVVGLVVAVLAATVDVRGAIGFSSFAVLVYYAVANASAWTLMPSENRPPRIGLAGCLLLAFTLPVTSVASGAAVLVLGCRPTR